LQLASWINVSSQRLRHDREEPEHEVVEAGF
jgi:hypothetical protein